MNIKGRRFGRLVAKRFHHSTGRNGGWHWLCRCDCGQETVVLTSALTRGNTRSCGCLQRDVASKKATPNSIRPKQRRSPTYITWAAMKRRCQSREPKYHGVKMCARWRSFAHFLADMGERPPGKTLDRWPDPAGNYEPGNCRWATSLQQRHNRRSKQLMEHAGR